MISKRFFWILMIAITSQFSEAGKNPSPLEVVNMRMDAHNNHNLEAFLAMYSEEIQIYDYPNTPIGKMGKAHIKSIFKPLFTTRSVNVKIHHQIEHGDYVVNHETVTRQGKVTNYVSIYEVRNGLITNVRFLRD